MELELWRILVLLFSSLLIGFIGGCVGIALGVVRVPIMTFLGIDPLVAAGSNLFVTLLGSIGGLWPAFTQKRIVWRVVILVGIPSLFGSFIGALYAGNFSQFILLILIGAILFLSAISIILVSSFELFKKDRNDLQKIVEKKYPKVSRLIIFLSKQKGCFFSRMTGSGSSCYGVFNNIKTARLALTKIKRKCTNY